MVLGILLSLLLSEAAVRGLDGWLPEPSLWPSISADVKAQQISQLPSPPRLVLIGSSITDAAVISDYLGELTGLSPTYNAAIPFFSPIVGESWVDGIRFALTNVELTIVGIPIWPAHSTLFAESLASKLDRAASHQSRVGMWSGSALLSHEGVLAHWDRLNRWTVARGQQLWTREGHFTGYYETADGSIDREFQPYGEPRMDPAEYRALGRMVESLQSFGSTVVLLIEPGEYPGVVSDSVEDEYVEWIRGVADEWGVEVWNTHDRVFDVGYFADELHFNRSGSVAFTEYLAGLINASGEFRQ